MNTVADDPAVMIRRGNKKTAQTGDTRFPGGGGGPDKAMPLQPLGHGSASKEAASETTDLVPKTRCILFSSFKKCSLVVVDDSISVSTCPFRKSFASKINHTFASSNP